MTRPGPADRDALVSVIVRTRGQRQYLTDAIRSVLRQTSRNLQILVANTAPVRLGEALGGLDDGRNNRHLLVLDLPPDAGRAAATNAALARADGKYVAYVDAGDVLYPRHIESLTAALADGAPVAYSDHYLTYRRGQPGRAGHVLSKVLGDRLHYDPLLLCRRDYIPLTALMHRRDLLDRVGMCNEDVKHLVDWDLTRRLATAGRFRYLPILTAERSVWVQDRDGAASDTRAQAGEYLRDRLLIRTTRPPKPWPGMADLSVIFTPTTADERAMQTLRQIWRWTFAPYQVVLPLPAFELAQARTEMPNLRRVPVGPADGLDRRVDQALACCEGQYVAIVSPEIPIRDGWVETALHALIHCRQAAVGILLDGAQGACQAAVLRKADLIRARREYPGLSVSASLQRAGVGLRARRADEAPFLYESVVTEAEDLQRIGDGKRAAQLLAQIRRQHPEDLNLQLRAASALYQTRRNDDDALALCQAVNRARPTVDSLVLEARLHRRADRVEKAIALLEESRWILDGKG